MESGSQIGTYVAYFFVVLFLLVVAVAAARSYGMILSLVALVFMGNTKPDVNAGVDSNAADNSNDGNSAQD